MSSGDHPGYQLIRSQELKGESLAWAVAAVYQMHAAIVDGRVHVEAEPGRWLPFDPSDMLRSLVVGHTPDVLVPDEIAVSEFNDGTTVKFSRNRHPWRSVAMRRARKRHS